MNIGLYKEPVNPLFPNYRGLYRQNNLIDLYENGSKYLTEFIKRYYSDSIDGIYLQYNHKNKLQLISLYQELKHENWSGEIILFTDNTALACPDDCELIGYDICADSKYYSPLGDGFLEVYDENDLFFSEMDFNIFKRYKDNINENGLFSVYYAALEFSQYCKMINDKYEHMVESENNYRPFAVFAFKQSI